MAKCDFCGKEFEPTAIDLAEAKITGLSCPVCWFKMTGPELACSPEFPFKGTIEQQMAFTCSECSDSECKALIASL